MVKTSIIQTKLQPPPEKPGVVLRRDLFEKLNHGIYRKVVLISAPAGYGKTTLVAAWSRTYAHPVAWLSLDASDNDLRGFLGHFIQAIQTVSPGACGTTLALLDGQHLPPLNYLVNSLINEISALSNPVIVVLDDYHMVIDGNIHELLATFIKHQPGQIHLVIVTRHDPAIDLVKLRSRNELTEIRIHNLRFTEAETRLFLQSALGSSLESETVARIMERTEGWPVILHLACVALRESRHPEVLLDNLKASNQFIMGYLVQEILSELTPDEGLFLTYTSILDRFCAELCEAVMTAPLHGMQPVSTSGTDMLNRLHRANLLVLPLDYEGVWYRYHHLFQEFLYRRLNKDLGVEQIQSLHTAAGVWLQAHGHMEEAFYHYQRASNIEAQIAVIAAQRQQLMNQTQWQQLEAYLKHFPVETIRQHPDLLMLDVWLLYHSHQWEKLPETLAQLESLLASTDLSKENENQLRGEMASVYALLAYVNSQPQTVIEQAEIAIRQSAPELWIVRTLARNCLAAGLQMIGDWGSAVAVSFQGLSMEAKGSNHFRATELTANMNINWVAANMHDLVATARQNIALSRDSFTPEISGFGYYHLGCALYQLNDLQGAAENFRFVAENPYVNYGEVYIHSAIGLALTYTALGQPDAANEVCQSMIGFLMETDNHTGLRIAHAFRAELALRQNRNASAESWASQYHELPRLTPPHRFYFPGLTLVKSWLAQGTKTSQQRAESVLNSLEDYLSHTHNTRFLIEVLALKALLLGAMGKRQQAVKILCRALEMAYPGGMLRVFLDLGSGLRELLHSVHFDDAELRQYARKLLSHFEAEHTGLAAIVNNPDPESLRPEDLTSRELDILHYIDQRKTNREIAQMLNISENTVRYHLKNIYAKLDVHSRRTAATKARILHLLPIE